MSEWGEFGPMEDVPSHAACSEGGQQDSTQEGENTVGNASTDSEDIYSGIDGQGMWKSWTDQYTTPRSACWDLLDNCFDAALGGSAGFQGRVAMDIVGTNGIVITNNSSKKVKPLKETLTLYRSEKNATKNENISLKKDAIGEYGVGLKQACATLSDTTFVLTKNITQGNGDIPYQAELELGVIAKDLQTTESVGLPHFSYAINVNHSSPNPQEQIQTNLKEIFRSYPFVQNLVTNLLGNGNRREGLQKLVQHYLILVSSDDWNHQPHTFQLIITDFKRGSQQNAQATNNGIVARHPAGQFLEKIRDTLPEQYINVPLQDFQFLIQNKPVQFCYWQHRLVEMTKFEVYIPKDKPVEELPDNGAWTVTGYPLSIYCGFDALRLHDKHQNLPKTCHLYIYSRKSGRRIDTFTDARGMLGMPATGTTFSQGLTILIDDVAGELPLKPTKDGLTWSKEQQGHIHESNLLAWTGAVGTMYYNYHSNLFKARVKEHFKSALADAILTFVNPIEKRLEQYANSSIDIDKDSLEAFEKAKFCMFSDPQWQRVHIPNSQKVRIRRLGNRKADLWRNNTPATVWKFEDWHYPPKQEDGAPATKRRRSSGVATPASTQKRRNSSVRGRDPDSAVSEAAPWECLSRSDGDSGQEGVPGRGGFSSPSTSRRLAFVSPEAHHHAVQGSRDSFCVNGANLDHVPPLPNIAPLHAPTTSQEQQCIEQQHQQQKIQELEKALHSSKLQVLDLNMRLKDASQEKEQLQQHMEAKQQSLQSARQEISQLKQQRKAQDECHQHSLQCATQEIVQLKQQKKDNDISHQQSLQKATDKIAQLKQEKKMQDESHQKSLQRAMEEIAQLKQQHRTQLDSQQHSLQCAKNEIAQLKHQEAAAKRNLQELEEVRSHANKMESQVQSLQLELEKRKRTIEQMSGGNGFLWGEGTDMI